LCDKQVIINAIHQQMKDVVVEIKKEHSQLIDAEERYQIMKDQMENYITEQESRMERQNII